MGRFLGITGAPGTGKKTVAPRVAKALGVPCVGLNALVTEAEKARGLGLVDVTKLRGRLIRRTAGRTVVFGHLLPDVMKKGDVESVAVLRCEPSALKHRLVARRYSAAKLAANIEAELIGLVSAACISRFGAGLVSEFDTSSRSPQISAKLIARFFEGRRPGRRIDWMPHYSSAEKLRSLLSDARTDSALTWSSRGR